MSYPQIGPPNDPAATVGGQGTANAKLRLMTTQLDLISKNTAALSGGITLTASISGITIDAVGIEDGGDVTQGAIDDAASTAGGAGTVSAKLRLMTTQLDDITDFVDGLETNTAATNALLTTANATGSLISTQLTTIDGRVDGLEGKLDTVNTNLTTIDGHVDGIEGKLDTVNTNLGTIDGHVDQLEAATIAISGFVTAPRRDAVRWGTGIYTVQTAQINASVAGDSTAVSGATGKLVTVLSFTYTVSGVVNVALKSNATTVFQPMYHANVGAGLTTFPPQGFVCQTNSGEHLLINLSTSVPVHGYLQYILADG